jgi:hypothetical protein
MFTDSFEHQFSFYYYLAQINDTIISFLNNNNLDLNYVCFAKFDKEGVTNIITTDIVRRLDNGYRLITIENCDSEKNYVSQVYDSFVIFYENIKILISEQGVDLVSLNIDIHVPTECQKLPEEACVNMLWSRDVDYDLVYKLENICYKTLPVLSLGLNVKKIEICYLQEPIIPGFLPNTITSLVYNAEFPLGDGVLPSSLLKLILRNNFDQQLVLPPSLKKLILSPCFNQKLELPISLEKLECGYYFNQELVLPISLLELVLGYKFNRALEVPNSLRVLIIGDSFNKKLELPDSLRILRIGNSFNYELKLPDNLYELDLGYSFNQKLELPVNISIVILGKMYNNTIVVFKNIDRLEFR